jgi:hypothetical protein
MSKRALLALTAFACVATTAAAAAVAIAPAPGGPAPKSLLGTWGTTVTRADEARSAAPDHWPNQSRWELVIVNAGDGVNPRALGLRPRGEGGDSLGFGIKGTRLFLQCLDGNGIPTAGYGTYTWRLQQGTLWVSLVKEPCRDKDLRNRITVLTSHPWRRVR